MSVLFFSLRICLLDVWSGFLVIRYMFGSILGDVVEVGFYVIEMCA